MRRSLCSRIREGTLEYLRYQNTATGEVTEYRPPAGENFGVFVFAGYEPATDLVRGIAECDERGYIVTDRMMKTSCDGLYAAGDVCIKPLRQVVTAVGDGALAATELERYAVTMQKKTGRCGSRRKNVCRFRGKRGQPCARISRYLHPGDDRTVKDSVR